MAHRTQPGIDMVQDDPLWYKDAVFYEIPVKAFADGNGDGIGDACDPCTNGDAVRAVKSKITLPNLYAPLGDVRSTCLVPIRPAVSAGADPALLCLERQRSQV